MKYNHCHCRRYVLDPVLGDDGQYYTARSLRDCYLKELVPLLVYISFHVSYIHMLSACWS